MQGAQTRERRRPGGELVLEFTLLHTSGNKLKLELQHAGETPALPGRLNRSGTVAFRACSPPPRRRPRPRNRTQKKSGDEDENEREEDFNLQLSPSGGFRYK
jgi:hypothetical protein